VADTPKTAADLIADFPTNGAQEITAERLRNLVLSIVPAIARFSMTQSVAVAPLNTVDFYEVVPTAAIIGPMARYFTYAGGRLTYTGPCDIHVHVAVTLSTDAVANNQTVSLRVAKNADPTEVDAVASETDQKMGTGGDVDSTAVHYDTMMSTGDYLSVWLRNQTSAGVVTVRHVYFFILGMLDVSGL